MKNLYVNERGNWATRSKYLRIARVIVWLWLAWMIVASIQLLATWQATKVLEYKIIHSFIPVK